MHRFRCGVRVSMPSDGVVGEDVSNAGPDDTAQVSVEQPSTAVNPPSHNSNATSVPSYQYDSSGMTELSLVTDEVRHSCFLATDATYTLLGAAVFCGKIW